MKHFARIGALLADVEIPAAQNSIATYSAAMANAAPYGFKHDAP